MSEKEYIEHNKTIRDLEELCADGKMIGNNNSTYIDFADVIDVVAEQPTTDVQEVVRCKDCYWSVPWNIRLSLCRNFNMVMKPDDFCSCGEKE